MTTGLPLREVRDTFYSPDSEDSESTATSIYRRASRKQRPRDVRSFSFRFFEKPHYFRRQVYRSKGKRLFEKLGSLTAIENLPLPFAKREYEPGEEWIKGALLCVWGSGAILCLNIVLAVIAIGIAYSKSSGDTYFTYAELYRGDCSLTNGWTTGMHLVINVLSTALLAASNYVMQCLSAPSRADVDRAHSKRKWLNIGIFSWRNFSAMDGKRKTLCFLLFVSTLPIHMMYNSAIFPSISTLGHGTVVIPNDLGRNESLVKDKYEAKSFYDNVGFSADDVHAEIFNGTFQNLTMSECFDKYSVDYNSDGGTLLLVANRTNLYSGASSLFPMSVSGIHPNERWMYENSLLGGKQNWEQMGWEIKAGHWNYPLRTFQIPTSDGAPDVTWPEHYINPPSHGNLHHDMNILKGYIITHNPDDEQLDVFLKTTSNWHNSSWAAQVSFQTEGPSRGTPPIYGVPMSLGSVPSIPLSHCMAKGAVQRCRLYFSLPICLVVIACNIVKMTCMYMAASAKHGKILLTVGDSLSSFLQRPDAATEGRCFMSLSDMTRGFRPWKFEATEMGDTMPLSDTSTHRYAQTFPELLPGRRRWFRAASWKRWGVTVALFFACFAASIFLFHRGKGAIPDFWARGIGKPRAGALFGPRLSVISLLLIANSPQLVFSALYYLCNGILTCMLAVAEYNDFATQRKPLRVSWPKGQQRSTYYLSLPYRYGIFLIATSIAMHWLLSQSVFLVKIIPYNVHGKIVEYPSWNSTVERLVTACGFSVLAMLITMILGIVAMAVLVGLSMRRLRSNMPLASSCSAAISAACHPPPGDTDAFLKPVMWGEVPGDSRDTQNGCASDMEEVNSGLPGYGHCTFTSKDVVTPSMIRLYR